MRQTDSITEFLKEDEIRLTLTASEIKSCWLNTMLAEHGWTALTIVKSGGQALPENLAEGFECRLIPEEGNALGLIYNGKLDTVPLELFGMDISVSLPDSFGFLKDNRELETSYLTVYFSEEDLLENVYIGWNKKILILPGLLELDQVSLQITRRGMFVSSYAKGSFLIGNSFSMYLGFSFGYGDEITMEIGASDGAFPSFFDFMKWVAAELSLEMLFSWADVGSGYLDVALSAASITVDIVAGSLADAMAKFKLCLFGLDFEASFYLASRTLHGGLWEGTVLRVGELLEHLGVGGEFPEYLHELMELAVMVCDLDMELEEKRYCVRCRVEGDLHFGHLALRYVDLEVQSCSGNTSFKIRGNLVLETNISLRGVPMLSDFLPEQFTYEAGGVSITYDTGSITNIGAVLEYQTGAGTADPKTGESSVHEPVSTELISGDMPTADMKPEVLNENNGTDWNQIRKQIGPAYIDQAGISFENNIFLVRLSGGISAGPVGLNLKGLSVGYDLAKKELMGGLLGIGLYYHSDVFSIEGSISKKNQLPEGVIYQYDGTVLIRAGKWQIAGMASYAGLEDGTVSLFIYADCFMMLGGVPAFQVTGLMGGFGLNRKLNIPEVKQIGQFPLMKIGKKITMDSVLTALTEEGPEQGKTWLAVSKGDYWAAAGVSFQSFGLVEGKLLLALLFGNDLQIALIGSAELTLPKGAGKEQAYAYLKIFLSAVLKPKEGSLIITAVLSGDSFVICKDCRVSGGAAFAVWFGANSHAGDFVLTVGGYHPAFRKPEHYPLVDRIGFQWQVSSTVSAKGDAYMAVTPSCVMAGGNLQFVFEMGALKAWFTAYADMIMYWHPFYFIAQIGIEIGISLRLNLLFCHKTLTLSAGADLGLWGPAIGGSAKVHISIISFTVSFGAKKKEKLDLLSWEEFQKLLPEQDKIHHISSSDGIQNGIDGSWISRTGKFTLNLDTEIPAGQVGIRPMGLRDVSSKWTVDIISPGGKTVKLDADGDWNSVQGLELNRVTGNYPEALWGRTPNSSQPEAKLMEGLTSGCQVNAGRVPVVKGEYMDCSLEDLIHFLEKTNPLELRQESERRFEPMEGSIAMSAIREMSDPIISDKRARTCRNVAAYYSGPFGTFENLVKELDVSFEDSPMLCQREG